MLPMERRQFLTAGAAAAAAAQAQPPAPIRLGLDLFSLRSQGWNAFDFLAYAAKQRAQVVHFSEIRFLGSLEEEHLKKVRSRAAELGIQIETGMRSICPTSRYFDAAQGPAEEQLARMIAAAKTAGSPIVRCFLGMWGDRANPPGIESHIENTIKTLKAVRTRALDAGIKIAVENHGGDMQARELKMLIEEAGPDYAGVCLDSGNPVWAIEDPHLTLETLAPYVLTSHVRDSRVWLEDGKIAVAWVRMGEGNIGIEDYTRKFQQLCPGRAYSLEIICTGPRYFAWQDPKFWDGFRRTPAWEFARFLAIAEKGKPFVYQPPPKEEAAARERADLELSYQFTRESLHVG